MLLAPSSNALVPSSHAKPLATFGCLWDALGPYCQLLALFLDFLGKALARHQNTRVVFENIMFY